MKPYRKAYVAVYDSDSDTGNQNERIVAQDTQWSDTLSKVFDDIELLPGQYAQGWYSDQNQVVCVAVKRFNPERLKSSTKPAIAKQDSAKEAEELRRGELIAHLLKLRKGSDGLYHCSGEWGTKTSLGLYRTVKRIVLDGE